MDSMKLDPEDIDLLFAALKVYEGEPLDDYALSSLMKLTTRRLTGMSEARLRAEMDEEKKVAEKVNKLRSEQVIMLKAKLLMWRDQMTAQAAADEALRKP